MTALPATKNETSNTVLIINTLKYIKISVAENSCNLQAVFDHGNNESNHLMNTFTDFATWKLILHNTFAIKKTGYLQLFSETLRLLK